MQRWEYPYKPSALELRVEREALQLWQELQAGNAVAFVTRTALLVKAADFASPAKLLQLSTSFFQHGQAGDGRLEGALEMLAAVVWLPAGVAQAGATQRQRALQRASGLEAVMELQDDDTWTTHNLCNTKLGHVLEHRLGIATKKETLAEAESRGGTVDGVWCAVAFAFVVVATFGCPAIVRSCLQLDKKNRPLGAPLYLPLEFKRKLEAENNGHMPDLRRNMRQLLHALWKWWRARNHAQQPFPGWDHWIGARNAPGLTAKCHVWRGILLEWIVEGAFACGFLPLVGSAEELRAGLAYAAAAVAQPNRVTTRDGEAVQPTAADWEACARASAQEGAPLDGEPVSLSVRIFATRLCVQPCFFG